MVSRKATKALASQKGQTQSSTERVDLSDRAIMSLTYARVVNQDRGDFGNLITKSKTELVGNNLRSYLKPSPATSVGYFSLLQQAPVVLNMTLQSFSYEYLRRLMRSNKHVWNMVVANPVYQNITQHAQGILTTLSQNGLGACFSIKDLHEVLTNPECAYCPRPRPSFGAYVFLPGLVRVCEHCATKDHRCIPLDKERAMKARKENYEDREYGLKKKWIEKLPLMTTTIGGSKVSLISRPLAQEALVKQIMSKNPKIRRSDIHHVKPRRMNDPESEWAGLRYRYPAIAHMPYLDLKENAVVKGRRCLGCKSKYFNKRHYCDEETCEGRDYASPLWWKERDERWNEIFSTCKTKRIMMMEYLPNDFVKHINKCEYAQAIYEKKARKGTLEIQETKLLTKADLKEIDGPVWEDPMWKYMDRNPCASEDDDAESPESSEPESESTDQEILVLMDDSASEESDVKDFDSEDEDED